MTISGLLVGCEPAIQEDIGCPASRVFSTVWDDPVDSLASRLGLNRPGEESSFEVTSFPLLTPRVL